MKEGNINVELEKIKKITKQKIKKDPRIIRRTLPDVFYKIYKKTKFFF